MQQGKLNGRNWLTALILSPGMLFAGLYLTVWLSTNAYLDQRFGELLATSFEAAAGERYHLRVGELSTGIGLSSLTLERLELHPEPPAGSLPGRPIVIDRIVIDCPEVGLLLFRPSAVEAASRAVARRLLGRCPAGALSMHHEPGPLPADR